jgi:hypothetical protein
MSSVGVDPVIHGQSAEPTRPAKPASRASLACVQCRSRHLRCDATKPVCSRCRQQNSECSYLKSRRGARSRSSIQEHQRPPTSSSFQMSPGHGPMTPAMPFDRTDSASSVPPLVSDRSAHSSSNSSSPGSEELTIASPGSVGQESTLDLFYIYFHTPYPCALPKPFFKQRMNEDTTPGVRLLASVMGFIGSLYAPKVYSQPLEDQVKAELASPQPYLTGFEVQALTLYSIALYWCDELQRSRDVLDDAINKAIALGMNTRNFAEDNSGGDPVMAESWRRTWWQLYLTDMHLSCSNHATFFTTSQRNITATVELPCEESEYLSGVRNLISHRCIMYLTDICARISLSRRRQTTMTIGNLWTTKLTFPRLPT